MCVGSIANGLYGRLFHTPVPRPTLLATENTPFIWYKLSAKPHLLSHILYPNFPFHQLMLKVNTYQLTGV